ncbi:Ubiquitin-conjugating enzyme E2 D2B [Frankliniella fusca]|uniref:Ubiquitin-conjugating enzyme E2 D2B n=1 Tax=Frankliniella fusca TaxID=407009 RepID=A0AAE1HBK6_9NEOP|nr:Ubiquitin-conjugating enzyme E2 D2B [Frankliniella fusca]
MFTFKPTRYNKEHFRFHTPCVLFYHPVLPSHHLYRIPEQQTSICDYNILKPSASGSEGKWVPGTTLSMLMVAIRSLLTDPNLDDPIVPSIAREKADTPDVFCFKAKKWTEKYAK